jgi:hypothetical protein
LPVPYLRVQATQVARVLVSVMLLQAAQYMGAVPLADTLLRAQAKQVLGLCRAKTVDVRDWRTSRAAAAAV